METKEGSYRRDEDSSKKQLKQARSECTSVDGGGRGGDGGVDEARFDLVELADDLEGGPEFELHGVDQVVVPYEIERRAIDVLCFEELRDRLAGNAAHKLVHLVAAPLGRVAARVLGRWRRRRR